MVEEELLRASVVGTVDDLAGARMGMLHSNPGLLPQPRTELTAGLARSGGGVAAGGTGGFLYPLLEVLVSPDL